MYQATTALKKISSLKKRIRALQGGTSASKTVSAVMLLIHMAQQDKKPTKTSIVSESLPHLKRGAMLDFLSIMQQHGYYKDDRWNKSDFTYTFETGSKIEFFSVDQPSKVRGPRRDRLFINEGNNVPYETFDQLEIRTKDFIIVDWNPVVEFWYHTEVEGKRDDVDFVILTYLDNEALDPQIRASIELRKNNKNWWRVYGLGLLGEITERIYTGWEIIDDIPHEARLERRGLDFGYTNDPTAIVDTYRYNSGVLYDEQLYQRGLQNKPIADFILNLPNPQTLVIADKSEPKSIDEIKSYGINILPSQGGPDSIRHGIQLIQNQKIWITKRSINLIKEYRSYLWLKDRDGRVLNVPEGGFDHALDAARYATESLNITQIDKKLPKFEEEKPLFSQIGI